MVIGGYPCLAIANKKNGFYTAPDFDLLCTLFGTLPTNVQSVGVGPEGQVGSRSAALMRLASVEALVGSGWAWMLTYALQRFSWVIQYRWQMPL